MNLLIYWVLTYNSDLVYLGNYSACSWKECVCWCFRMEYSLKVNWVTSLILLLRHQYPYKYFLSLNPMMYWERKAESLNKIVDLPTSSCYSVSFGFVYFEALFLGVLRIVIFSWRIHFLPHCEIVILFLVLFLCSEIFFVWY